MSQAKKTNKAKTTTAAKPVAKAAEAPAKAAETTIKAAPRLSAIESNVTTPDHMLQAGTEAAKDFIAAGTMEAQKTQEKVLNMSAEGIQQFSKNADAAARQVAENFSISREQFNALMESGKIAGDLSRDLHDKLVADMNSIFSENVELSKDLLACRTLNDLVEVQNRAFQSTLSHFFENSARLTDAWFKLATEASEPVATQTSQVVTRLNKSIAA